MFVILVEDEAGHVYRAFTWRGRAIDGINRAKEELRNLQRQYADIWAIPAPANR